MGFSGHSLEELLEPALFSSVSRLYCCCLGKEVKEVYKSAFINEYSCLTSMTRKHTVLPTHCFPWGFQQWSRVSATESLKMCIRGEKSNFEASQRMLSAKRDFLYDQETFKISSLWSLLPLWLTCYTLQCLEFWHTCLRSKHLIYFCASQVHC